MPKQTNKMYLRQGGKPGLAWCVSDVSDYCADVLVGKFGSVTEDDVVETVNDLRDNNPIIGIEEEKEPVEARIPVRQYMSKMVVPGYVILGSTPYMTIPVMTPPLSKVGRVAGSTSPKRSPRTCSAPGSSAVLLFRSSSLLQTF